MTATLLQFPTPAERARLAADKAAKQAEQAVTDRMIAKPLDSEWISTGRDERPCDVAQD